MARIAMSSIDTGKKAGMEQDKRIDAGSQAMKIQRTQGKRLISLQFI